MRGLSKKTIAKEATRQLGMLVDMLCESGNWDVGGVEYHANSANNYLKAQRDGGESVPENIERNRRFLTVHGWRIPT
jgi:hypothetical protein